jgi:hypothetical protein
MQLQAKINKETKQFYAKENPEKKIKKDKKIKDNKQNIIIPPVNLDSNLSENLIAGMNGMNIDSENYLGKKNDYLERENQILIHHYGPELYDYSKEMESHFIEPNFLLRHKLDSQIRTKMVDWMIEVLYAYNSDPPTIFLAVNIMDTFIAKTKSIITNNDIHLIGIVSLFIASKMEDIIPLRMSHIKGKIGHNKFSEKDIKKKEKQVLETINFDIITTSTYDFIKTYIFDFRHNNQEYIIKLKMTHHIDSFDNTCIFLSKMMFHHEDFCQYK